MVSSSYRLFNGDSIHITFYVTNEVRPEIAKNADLVIVDADYSDQTKAMLQLLGRDGRAFPLPTRTAPSGVSFVDADQMCDSPDILTWVYNTVSGAEHPSPDDGSD